MVVETEQSLVRAEAARQALLEGKPLHFRNGVRVPPITGRILQRHDSAGERWPTPLRVDLSGSLYRWLLEEVAPDLPIVFPRIALLIWEARDDLQLAFPQPTAKDLRSFMCWFVHHGQDEMMLDDVFVVSTRAGLTDLYRQFVFRESRASSYGAPHFSPAEVEWLTIDMDPRPGNPPVTRLAMILHRSRKDLQDAYPDPLGSSRRAFAYWFFTDARIEYGLGKELFRPLSAAFPLQQRLSAALRIWRQQRLASSDATAAHGESPAAESLAPRVLMGEDVEEKLEQLHGTWESLARSDPLWAILSTDDKRHGRWDHEEFFRTGEEEIAGVLEEVENLGLTLERTAALDFGCGAGRLTRALGRRFDRALGVDISETMIRLARRHSPEPNVEYHLNQRTDLSFLPDNAVTFAYTGRVLQHIRPEEAREYLRELLRVLTPGGIAVFQVPSEVRGDPVEDAMPDEAYQAGLRVSSAPETMAAGATAVVEVEVENVSPRRWPSVEEVGIYQLRLASKWLTEDGEVLVENDGRTSLEEALDPGRTRHLDLVVEAPAETGRFLLHLDLVQEFVAWFSSRGSVAVNVPITVVAAETAATASERSLHAAIEMNTIPRSEIEVLIDEAGGELVHLETDDLAGPEWISHRYFARKVSQRPYLHQHPRRLLAPARRPLSGEDGWRCLLEPQEGFEPLNYYCRLLWTGSHHLQHLLPLDTAGGRQRLLAWLHLDRGHGLDVQSWLLPPFDWRWFDELSPEIEGEEGWEVTNFLHLVWCLRPELRQASPLTSAEGRRRLVQWAAVTLDQEYADERARIRERIDTQAASRKDRRRRPGVHLPASLGKHEAGVNVVEHPDATLGISEDVRMSLLALEAARVPGAVASIRNAEADAGTVSREFRYAANLIHCNADLMPQVCGQLGPQALLGRYNIAYCLWELPHLPPQWAASLSLVDEVWVPSRFVYECFARVSPVPVVHLPYAVTAEPDTSLVRKDFGLPEKPFLFLTSFDASSYVARKNPWAAIEAFRRAFDRRRDDVGLVVKCASLREGDPQWGELVERISEDPRIHWIDQRIERRRVLALVDLCDAYLSLHRSEGFGRGPAEAMLLGKPVVVTDFSGSTDFATPETACTVKARLIPVGGDEYPFAAGQVWADPDVDMAAGHMERLVEDESLRRSLARRGQRLIRSTYNPTLVGRRFAERLKLVGLL